MDPLTPVSSPHVQLPLPPPPPFSFLPSTHPPPPPSQPQSYSIFPPQYPQQLQQQSGAGGAGESTTGGGGGAGGDPLSLSFPSLPPGITPHMVKTLTKENFQAIARVSLLVSFFRFGRVEERGRERNEQDRADLLFFLSFVFPYPSSVPIETPISPISRLEREQLNGGLSAHDRYQALRSDPRVGVSQAVPFLLLFRFLNRLSSFFPLRFSKGRAHSNAQQAGGTSQSQAPVGRSNGGEPLSTTFSSPSFLPSPSEIAITHL